MREVKEKERIKMAIAEVSAPLHYPDIGDYIVITNNTVSHDIPIGTIFKVETLEGHNKTIVVDDKHSLKYKNLPEDIRWAMWVSEDDYALLYGYEEEAK